MKITFGTGVFAPDGYEEQWTEEICDECQKQQGVHKVGCCIYCEDCYEDFLERRKEDEMEQMLEDLKED